MEPVVSKIKKAIENLDNLSTNVNESVIRMKAVTESLDHSFAEYIQDQKMQSISLMAGGIAHDFNNFIHIINMNTNLIMTLGKDQKINERCKHIIDACSRTSELIEVMSTLANGVQLWCSEINLNEQLRKDIELLDGTLSESVKLETQFCSGNPVIIGNATQIGRVVTNLVKNAEEALDGKGSIVVETKKAVLEEEECMGHANARPGRFFTVSVTDSGPGIPKNEITRIFEPFFSTKKKNNNTGLGLAMVYAIVRDHYGWVDVMSNAGIGTRFTIYFPAREEHPGMVSEDASNL